VKIARVISKPRLTGDTLRRRILLGALTCLAAVLTGCGGGSDPGSGAKPTLTAFITATPTDIDKGQTSMLAWWTSGATNTTISGIGSVPPIGSRQVAPHATDTYTLTASGAGGTRRSSVTVTVTHSETPISHVIVIFLENRSTDNLFHGLPGADIANTGINSKGETITLTAQPLDNDYDLSHSHIDFVRSYDGGKMDGADRVGAACVGEDRTSCLPPNPQFGYVNPQDVAPYFQMAENYTFADRMFQTNQGPSFPAHQFIFSATSTPSEDSDLLVAENPRGPKLFTRSGCVAPDGQTVLTIDPNGVESIALYPCFEHTTLSDSLEAAGLSWRYYSAGLGNIWTAPNAIRHICEPNAATNGQCIGQDWVSHLDSQPADLLADIAGGDLAAVSWIMPPGLSSDHPGTNDGSGPSWVASVVNAVGNSSYWANTVIFVTWDDWGGWYDHVAPPIINSYEYGFRVPLIIVSAYARPGYVSHATHDFGSIVRFAEVTFGLPSLGFADAVADDFSDCFDFKQAPRPFQKIDAPLGEEFFLHDQRPDVPLDND